MEITNQHRDVYKLVNNYYKRKKQITFTIKQDEYNLLSNLVFEGYLSMHQLEDLFYFEPTNKPFPRKQREKAFKWLFLNNERIPIKRCEKPKFGGKGRTWEKIVNYFDEYDILFHMDTTWGNYLYFAAPDGRWYKISGSRYSDILEELYTKDHLDFVWNNPQEEIELKY